MPRALRHGVCRALLMPSHEHAVMSDADAPAGAPTAAYGAYLAAACAG